MCEISKERELELSEDLLSFIGESPTSFHAVAAIRRRLDAAGFAYAPEDAMWDAAPGSKAYAVRNGSSVIAWHVGEDAAAGPGRASHAEGAARGRNGLDASAPYHYQITASHSDSPAFKLKSASELAGDGCLRLSVEAYGGMMDYTWFDRPLSLAGRVMVRCGRRIESRLVALDEDVAIIPSVAIHMNRDVNKAFSPNRAIDLMPLFSCGALEEGAVDALLARALGCNPEDVLARDLFLVNRAKGSVWGAAREFISSPRLDDLMCAYASLRAFIETENPRSVSVFACFDNEEVGSMTKQGAQSTFFADTLARLNAAMGYSEGDLHRALSASMLVSCDNAHAVHPAHPELADPASAPRLNGGLVIKEAANQHYCTDAFSQAALIGVLQDAGVPYQTFANRSDMAGGSTLGNISNTQVSVHAVDVGCAQLAMHSCVETAGSRDTALAVQALSAFYAADLSIDGADSVAF